MRLLLTFGLAVALASAKGWNSLPQSAASPFIDAHVHLNQPDSALAFLNRGGISRAIAFIGAQGTNEDMLRAARASNGRLIPFASVSPERREYRARWVAGDTSVVGELDRLLAGGEFRGIGEISVVHFGDDAAAGGSSAASATGRVMRTPARSRDSSSSPPREGVRSTGLGGFPDADFDPMGPVMRGIMQVAQRRQLPILIHCEVTRLREFSALLNAFPTVKVIWAHGGYTPLVLASRMLDRHPNLVYELSARTWSRHPRSPDYTIFRNDSLVWPEWLALIERHSSRFIVGTDATLRSMDNDRQKANRVQLLLSQLTDSTRERVATQNVMRLVTPATR